VALSGAVLAAGLSGSASASVPVPLAAATIKAAVLGTMGNMVTTGLVSAQVAALVKGVLQTMLLTKLKIVTLVAVAVVVGSLGTAASLSLYNPPVLAASAQADQAKDLADKVALAEKHVAVKLAALKVAEAQKVIVLAKLDALKAEVNVAKAAEDYAKKDLDRVIQLEKQKAVSIAEVDHTQAKYLSAIAQRQKAQASLAAGEAEVVLQAALRELAQAELAEAELQLKQLRDQLKANK
jgi:hypothetical protein